MGDPVPVGGKNTMRTRFSRSSATAAKRRWQPRAVLVEPLERRRLLSASLIKDINTLPALAPVAHPAVTANGTVYFASDSLTLGEELWRTDGTVAGTLPVMDLRPGVSPSVPRLLTPVGDALYFTADDGVHGRELWKTDGTAAGTSMVIDLVPGPGGVQFSYLVDVDGTAFFMGSDATGEALWRTDGTAVGTQLLGRFVRESPHHALSRLDLENFAPLYGFAVVDRTLYFRAATIAQSGFDLWKSDGTPAGTVLVKDLPPAANASSSPSELTVSNGKLFFSATDGLGTELWVSDGTTDGTTVVTNLPPSSQPLDDLTDLNGLLLFRNSRGVWRSDGTAAGTVLFMSPVGSGAGDLPPLQRAMARVGDTVYVAAANAGATTLRTTDGTGIGTRTVAQIPASPVTWMQEAGGRLIFIAGGDLWTSDGTADGTVPVKDFTTDTAARQPDLVAVAPDGAVYLHANDGAGRGLWRSDLTHGGTVLLRRHDAGTASSAPSRFTPVGNSVYFEAQDGVHGRELWKTDGTPGGTYLVRDFMPGPVSSSPRQWGAVNGRLLFNVDVPFGSTETWSTDGTPEGTLRFPVQQSTVLTTAEMGNALYWLDTIGLWKSDGTPSGTAMFLQNQTGASSDLVAVGTNLYFSDVRSGNQHYLYRSDGTAGGTVELAALPEVAEKIVPFRDGLLLVLPNRTTRQEDLYLWRPDDGPGALTLVKSDATDSRSADTYNMAVSGGLMYFEAFDEVAGYELWKSDGTPEGTVLVKDLFPGAGRSEINNLTDFNGRVLFTARSPTPGRSYTLWSSDGTGAGTHPFLDASGNELDHVTTLVKSSGAVYFPARTAATGMELWKSDGTAAGTIPLADIRPGALGSWPWNLTAGAGFVYFSAADHLHGLEPWRVATEAPHTRVSGRHLVYRRDGMDALAVDDAVASDKVALLPGQMASFSNVSNYSRGINGILIEMANLPADASLTAADFQLEVGGGATWSAVSAVPVVTVTPPGTSPGTGRVMLTLPDGAVKNTWLRVTVKQTGATGLATPDVFYFGNLVGETGPGGTPVVNAVDLARVRGAVGTTSATLKRQYDLNRDGALNVFDVLIVRASQGRSLSLFKAAAATATSSFSTTRTVAPVVPVRTATTPARRSVWDSLQQ
jgi:ELWxxDGT repeat protein